MQTRDQAVPPAAGPVLTAVRLTFLLAMGMVAVLVSGLTRDLSYDEAYSVLCYVLQGPQFILSHYTVPNNHILYSLLLSALPGDLPEALWRVPSLAAALATAWLLARILQTLAPEQPRAESAGLMLAFLLATPAFLSFATAVRGYALSMLLATLMLRLLLATPALGSTASRLSYSILAMLAIGVLPSNLFFLAGFALFDLSRDGLRVRTAITRAWPHLLGLTGLAIYAPVWQDVRRNFAFGWGVQRPELIAALLRATLPALAMTLCAGLLAGGPAGVRRMWRDGDPQVRRLATSGLIAMFASIALSGTGFARSYSPFLVVLALLTCHLAGRALTGARQRVRFALAVALVASMGWQVAVRGLLMDGGSERWSKWLPAYYEAADFDPWQTARSARSAGAPGARVPIATEQIDDFALRYYGILEGGGGRIHVGPPFSTDETAQLRLAPLHIAARNLLARDRIAAGLNIDPRRLVSIKATGFYKLWFSPANTVLPLPAPDRLLVNHP